MRVLLWELFKGLFNPPLFPLLYQKSPNLLQFSSIHTSFLTSFISLYSNHVLGSVLVQFAKIKGVELVELGPAKSSFRSTFYTYYLSNTFVLADLSFLIHSLLSLIWLRFLAAVASQCWLVWFFHCFLYRNLFLSG